MEYGQRRAKELETQEPPKPVPAPTVTQLKLKHVEPPTIPLHLLSNSPTYPVSETEMLETMRRAYERIAY